MRRAVLVLCALALAGCGHYRSEAEERNLAASMMTVYEAAEAIRIGRDPIGPVIVIQANASACLAGLGFPYPKKVTP